MLARSLASTLALALALVLPVGTGCTKKQQLTEVEVPEAGVSLRYDLSPGQEYDGHVKMRTTTQTPMGDIAISLEFDTMLVVSAKEEDGGKLVRATIKGIEMNVRTPDGIPAAAVGLDPAAADPLNGMELRFNLSPRGKVSNTPEPPEGASQGVQAIIGMITNALTAGLALSLPEDSLEGGQSWDATRGDQDEDVVSAKSTGVLEGLARNEAGEDVARLVYEAAIESSRTQGEHTVEVKQDVDTKAMFSASGGYPISLDRTIKNEIVGQVTILMEIESEWTKGSKQEVAPAPATTTTPETQVQAIDDPCDPDYVGMGECVEEGAEAVPEAEAAPEA